MRAFLPMLALSTVAQALYFYIDGSVPKCFFEELPKDTMVVGTYTAEEFDEQRGVWWKHDGLSIYISVDVRRASAFLPPSLFLSPLFDDNTDRTPIAPPKQETFDNDHRVVSNRGQAEGRFTFTAADAGEHKLCFTPSSNSGRSSWLSINNPNGGVRFTLDLAIGETSAIESSDKSKIEDIAGRIRDLNARLNDIRREQVFQREREAEFRDQSESTNARVIRWIIIQLVILGGTCAWQLSHLRSFFIKQKLT
ncbi:uncharacterized protein E0L32_003483 [Thyridium curvatum]|uniref:GOLD domain-containing protein n=1 Tax=Thyridium curvatum TaxID=1093900 RepID=A0A507BIS6_9PEZI|nr:uncharacterized protein E0L32_003483 [Thyridium curvatum]TPX16921.1 hypothetical protein E0L32_003483 [Thyridium curvatum]